MKEKNRFFTLLYIGKVDEKVLDEFNKNKEIEPYVKYTYEQKDELFTKKLEVYKAILNSSDDLFPKAVKKNIRDYINTIGTFDDPALEHYREITSDLKDLSYNDNGDALTTENPNGEYSSLELGIKNIGLPFLMKGGENKTISDSIIKGDVDWENQCFSEPAKEYYSRVWDICQGIVEPENDIEKTWQQNSQLLPGMFNRFISKEQYIDFSSSWGATAVIVDDKWYEVNELDDELEWQINFYDRFIKDLPDNTQLTLFECKS